MAEGKFLPVIGLVSAGDTSPRLRRRGKVGRPFKVFALDTGRLHPETYQFLEKVRTHYGIVIDAVFPQPGDVSLPSEFTGAVVALQFASEL